ELTRKSRRIYPAALIFCAGYYHSGVAGVERQRAPRRQFAGGSVTLDPSHPQSQRKSAFDCLENIQSRQRWRRLLRRTDLLDQPVANVAEKCSGRLITEVTARFARIAALADADVDRHFTKKRHIEFRRPALRSARAENVVPLPAIRTNEIAHVLDHPE